MAIRDADQERQAAHHHDGKEEIGGHRVLGERVDALHQAGSRDEGAEHHEDEGDRGRQHAPALEDAALAVHREAMDHRDAREPAHEAGVLHGVPRPEAAPPEHDVSPHRTQAHADGKVAQLDPARGQVAGDERGHGIGERYGHRGIADKGRRRMQNHGPMHEQRVHAADLGHQGAVGVEVLRGRGHKRIVGRRKDERGGKQRDHDLGHAEGRARELLARTAATVRLGRGECGDEPRPQQKRALTAGPHGTHTVERLQGTIGRGIVRDHVGQGVILGQHAHEHNAHAGGEQREGGVHECVSGACRTRARTLRTRDEQHRRNNGKYERQDLQDIAKS